jgi:mRNA interferase MazF
LLNDSLVLCEQIRTIDKARLIRYLGCLNENELDAINDALNISLGFLDELKNKIELHI